MKFFVRGLFVCCVGLAVWVGGVFAQKKAVLKAGQGYQFKAKGQTFKARWIPAGMFMMGSPPNEADRYDDEGPQRRVKISKGFWMLETEVTQGQYKALMGQNPSHFKKCGDNCPVEMVAWNDARVFADRLSKVQGLVPCAAKDSGIFQCKGWRLPTEAEWEYAARAGTTGSRYGEIDKVAWHSGNSDPKKHSVGGKTANAYEFYDRKTHPVGQKNANA